MGGWQSRSNILQGSVCDFRDRDKAKQLYSRVQEIVSREVPVFPLWYQANIVIARKNVGNINVDASGDWRFVRNLTLN
jgi:ABC-type transport system substrate-binding protein